MQSGNFVKVFDVLDSGYKDWTFPAFGLIFIAIGVGFVWWPQIATKLNLPYVDLASKRRKFFRGFFLAFALIWTMVAALSTYLPHVQHAQLVRNNECTTVEGPVQYFNPMPASGHGQEGFRVENVTFNYSDYIVTDGFNNTSSHGGPINKDSYVRICFGPQDHQILKLEIRDFKGPLRDYAHDSFFPSSNANQKNATEDFRTQMPWFINIFFVLYILDFFALLNLYIPYIRTFFVIKHSPLNEVAIPSSLRSNEKVKFQNALIFWDQNNKVIWLRPRGLNIFQVPLMATKFNTDDLGKYITSQEILFSSGMPIILMCFLLSAYTMFSVSMPGKFPLSALQFVAIGAILFTVVTLVNLVIIRGRMERLILRFLVELKDAPIFQK